MIREPWKREHEERSMGQKHWWEWSYPQRKGENGERTTGQGPRTGDFCTPSSSSSSELVLLCASVKNGVGNVIGERTKLDKALEHFRDITVLQLV